MAENTIYHKYGDLDVPAANTHSETTARFGVEGPRPAGVGFGMADYRTSGRRVTSRSRDQRPTLPARNVR